MTPQRPTPPSLAQLLVAKLIRDPRWRDVTLGDLDEEFDEQVRRRSLRSQGARLTAIGLALGLMAAVALARVIESALFGIVAIETSLFASITATLALAAVAATIVPAWRAMRLDPANVFRE